MEKTTPIFDNESDELVVRLDKGDEHGGLAGIEIFVRSKVDEGVRLPTAHEYEYHETFVRTSIAYLLAGS